MDNILQQIPFIFYGEQFPGYMHTNGNWYLVIDDICRPLGIDANGQMQRIKRDQALTDGIKIITVDTDYKDGSRKKEKSAMDLRYLPYWLGTIDANRIKEEHRAKVILFKKEFALAAWDFFRSDIISKDVLAEMDAHLSEREQQYHQIMDDLRTTRQKLDLLSGKTEEELHRVNGQLSDVYGRIGILETSLIGKIIINSAQAKWISDMIAIVAESAAEKNKKKSLSQHFSEVQIDFKTTFGIHIYSVLPENMLEAAASYLAGRWSRNNPGLPVPPIFTEGNQPSLF